MSRRSFILCSLSGFLGQQQTDLFTRLGCTADRTSLSRWQTLVDKAEEPEVIDSPGRQALLAGRLRRAIAEVNQALQSAPRDTGLHLMLIKLHLAGYQDDLFLSERVIPHARRAAVLAPDDPEVLALAGDAISFSGLVHDNIRLWREGVRLLRTAYRLKATPANRPSFRSAVVHCSA